MTGTNDTTKNAQTPPAGHGPVDRLVRHRLAVIGEPHGPCKYGRALLDSVRRFGVSEASFACHGSIDAPQDIPLGGVTATWCDWSTWGGEEGGTLKINTRHRDA